VRVPRVSFCVRVTSGVVSHVVCAFYFTDRDLRPCLPIGLFFADLYDVLDRLDTFVEPLFIVGNLNVHLEQTNYASVSQLIDLLADCGLAYHVPAQTHDLGGLLDVVASRDHRPSRLSTSACLTTVFYAGEFPKDDRH